MDEEDLFFEYQGDLELKRYYRTRPPMFEYKHEGVEYVKTGVDLHAANRYGIPFHKISENYEEYKILREKYR